jgi:hypothetical protein
VTGSTEELYRVVLRYAPLTDHGHEAIYSESELPPYPSTLDLVLLTWMWITKKTSWRQFMNRLVD